MKKILVIQTSFIGDAILVTSLLESLHQHDSDAQIELLVRKGNESLFVAHPFLNKVHVWDKQNGKIKHLLQTILTIRKSNFDLVLNTHRYLSSGLITWLSGAKTTVGFDKNPLSNLFTKSVEHVFAGKHEVERNHRLIESINSSVSLASPRLYPSECDRRAIEEFVVDAYRCCAPTSVWGTKQWPRSKWIEMINHFPQNEPVYLLGAPSDFDQCESIRSESKHPMIINLCGKLSLLQSAALMHKAQMNYTNDSAPMHLASAMNAPTTAVFCSTIPEFGFGPLSTNRKVIQTDENLDCRPCGIHGHSECPQGHFKCALNIDAKLAV